MTMTTNADATTQVYKVDIKAAPDAIWNAVTTPEWTRRYGYGCPAEYDLRPAGAYRAFTTHEMRDMGAPEVAVDGEVIEADRPHKLMQTWRMAMDPQTAAEGFTRLTWEIDEVGDGVSRLTVTHELKGAPKSAAMVSGAAEQTSGGGGWSWVLGEMKALLESSSTHIADND